MICWNKDHWKFLYVDWKTKIIPLYYFLLFWFVCLKVILSRINSTFELVTLEEISELGKTQVFIHDMQNLYTKKGIEKGMPIEIVKFGNRNLKIRVHSNDN